MIPAPCHCDQPNDQCRRSGRPMLGRMWEVCRGVNCTPEHSEKFRRAWDGLPPKSQTVVRPHTPCVHLGSATGQSVRCPSCTGEVQLKLFDCAKHGSCTTTKKAHGVACCQSGCNDYLPRFDPKPTDPRCGVAIGFYRWTRLAELQVRTIRHYCGPVPILLIDDGSAVAKARFIADLKDRYADITLWPNEQRIGHTGGDLSVVWKGVQWAKDRGLQVVAKLSQRFFLTIPRWLQDGAAELLQSGLPLATQHCRGHENFDLRTECMLLDVDQWNNPAVLDTLTPRRWGPPHLAESILYSVLKTHLGGVFYPWSLIGEERYEWRDGIVWHCSSAISEYRRLADKFGVALDHDFHNDGWQKDPTYLYG